MDEAWACIGPFALGKKLTPMRPHEVTLVQSLVHKNEDCSVKDAAKLLLSLRNHHRQTPEQSATSDQSVSDIVCHQDPPMTSKYIPQVMPFHKPLFDIPPPLPPLWASRRARSTRGEDTANEDDDEDYVVEDEEEDDEEEEDCLTGNRARASSGSGSADGMRLRRLGFYTLDNVRQVFHLPEEAACTVRIATHTVGVVHVGPFGWSQALEREATRQGHLAYRLSSFKKVVKTTLGGGRWPYRKVKEFTHKLKQACSQLSKPGADVPRLYDTILSVVRGLCMVYDVDNVWQVAKSATPVHDVLTAHTVVIERVLVLGRGEPRGQGTPDHLDTSRCVMRV